MQPDRIFGLSFASQLDPQRHLQQAELLLPREVGRPCNATPKPPNDPTPPHDGRDGRGVRGATAQIAPTRGRRSWRRATRACGSVGRECFQRAAHRCLQSLSGIDPRTPLKRPLRRRSSGGPGVSLTPSILRAVISIPSARPHGDQRSRHRTHLSVMQLRRGAQHGPRGRSHRARREADRLAVPERHRRPLLLRIRDDRLLRPGQPRASRHRRRHRL